MSTPKPYCARTLFHAADVCRLHAARHKMLGDQMRKNPTYAETQRKRRNKSLELAEVFTLKAREARAIERKGKI